MYPYKFLVSNHWHKLSEIAIDMISSSMDVKLGDAGEDVCRLGFSKIAKRSARMRFWLCGEIEDEEIGFKEITLCMVPWK